MESLQEIFGRVRDGKKGETKWLSKLLSYGRERGFDNFINRKLIWPYLLGVEPNLNISSFEWEGGLDRNSADFQQLQKDAERALASMKTFENITKFHLQKRQKAVLSVLDSFFARNKQLRYIQGFHDVASIFLVLFGAGAGYYLMERAGKTYFLDFLTRDIGEVGIEISAIVLELLSKRDEEFQKIFECFMETQFLVFIVPWVLTWFAHVYSSVRTICRIWDYLLSTGPHGILYLTAGIILVSKNDLLASSPELDQPSIHTFYQQQAKNDSIDIQGAIRQAISLQRNHPVTSLISYDKLPSISSLRLQVFEIHLDLHRVVREYQKQQEKNSRNTKMIVGAASLLLAGVLFYAKTKGKLHF